MGRKPDPALAPGEICNLFRVPDFDDAGLGLLQLPANLLRDGIVLAAGRWILDGEQELVGKAVDLPEAPDGRKPSVAMACHQPSNSASAACITCSLAWRKGGSQAAASAANR